MTPIRNRREQRRGQLSIGDFTDEPPSEAIRFDCETAKPETSAPSGGDNDDWSAPIQCKSFEEGRDVALEIVRIVQTNYHYFGGWDRAFETILDLILFALTRKETSYMDIVRNLDRRAVACAVEVYSRLFKSLYYDYCIYDILGDVYMQIGSLSRSKRFGQFFTPMHICELMAEIQLDNVQKKIQKAGNNHRKISVYDPCVGSGAMLLCCKRVILQKYGLYGLDRFAFYGTDIDHTCVKMCKIQMILTDYRYMADLLLSAAMDIRAAHSNGPTLG